MKRKGKEGKDCAAYLLMRAALQKQKSAWIQTWTKSGANFILTAYLGMTPLEHHFGCLEKLAGPRPATAAAAASATCAWLPQRYVDGPGH
eukprot:scaffold29146_cov19-Tisochrysis_lutea.AAC.1